MNSKVAKLIDMFAAETQVSSRDLKSKYRSLSNTQKRDFRHLMTQRLNNVLGGQEVQDFGAMNWRDRWYQTRPHLVTLVLAIGCTVGWHAIGIALGWF